MCSWIPELAYNLEKFKPTRYPEVAATVNIRRFVNLFYSCSDISIRVYMNLEPEKQTEKRAESQCQRA